MKTEIPKLALTKGESLIIAAMLLATGGFYTATINHENIDPYKFEIQQRTLKIDNIMKTVSHDSTIQELKNVQDELRLQVIWAERTKTDLTQDQLKTEMQFVKHLNGYNAVLISYSKK